MNTQREIEILAMIKSAFEPYRELLIDKRVILFGSRASEKNKERSDFDIGILGEKPLSIADFYKLKDALNELPTLYTIDLIDFGRVPDSFRNEALKNYTVLYA